MRDTGEEEIKESGKIKGQKNDHPRRSSSSSNSKELLEELHCTLQNEEKTSTYPILTTLHAIEKDYFNIRPQSVDREAPCIYLEATKTLTHALIFTRQAQPTTKALLNLLPQINYNCKTNLKSKNFSCNRCRRDPKLNGTLHE